MKRTYKARTKAILPIDSEAMNDASLPEFSPAAPSNENPVPNRLSGLDGIMSMMGSAQKFFSFFQQMQPMIKMAGSLFGPKAFLSSLPSEKPHSNNRKSTKGTRGTYKKKKQK